MFGLGCAEGDHRVGPWTLRLHRVTRPFVKIHTIEEALDKRGGGWGGWGGGGGSLVAPCKTYELCKKE